MVVIWDKLCELFATLVRPTRRKTRVSFSPSTLHRELARHKQLSPSSNPFFNFLAEIRLRAIGDLELSEKSSMTRREVVRLTKRAGRLWNSMTDEQKQPYRNIAAEQRQLKRLRRRRRRKSVFRTKQHGKRQSFNQIADAFTLSRITSATSMDSIVSVASGELIRKSH